MKSGVALDRAVFDQKVCTDSSLSSSLLDVRQISNFLRQLVFGDKTNVSANCFVTSQDRTLENSEEINLVHCYRGAFLKDHWN